ncbi:metallophosphoesterase family protein [Amphritea pacifica]|uniref:Metallophosphoesterase n=1 Tax=Amphritea pacifica TaxID=2811233 RepID=A0ABS2WD09_9GAMM|nr:metallophosphoesterase family protein [Amphritea pacifica]MBN0989597.1 metallophosphoesterase [Amphritea pacifica]MBN1008713.1 metallophosphoesterase [Amphritea pacifica]
MMPFKPNDASPLLIFGGPYSNLQATRAIRQVADKLGIAAHNILCTGDLVAYCAEPDQTVDLIRKWGIGVVAGNCEESVGNGAEDCGCGFTEGSSCDLLSAQWYNYTLPRVSEANKAWMRQLPNRICFNYCQLAFTVIHGGVDSNNQFIFASAPIDEMQQQLQQSGSQIIIAGHCGIPFGRETGSGYWLNAGVIGMPANDGTPDTWYMIITPTETQLTCSWHRLQYDHTETALRMEQSGLGNGYMSALTSGIWPSLDVLPEPEKDLTGRKLSVATINIPKKPNAI